MNREIKFRGIDVDSGQWMYGNLVMICNGETLELYPNIVRSFDHDTFDWNEVSSESVGQFTGLLDKSGKEIYESDIITIDTISLRPRIVAFLNGGFKYHIPNGSTYVMGAYESHEINIIGNIYENPELLKS